MKQVIFRLLLCLAALSLLGGRALAAEGTPSLPEEVVRAAPEAASLVNGDGAESFGLLSGAAALLDEGMEALRTYLFSGIRAVGAVMAGVVLLGALESAAPSCGDTLSRYGTAAGALWVTAMAAGDLHSLIGLGEQTIVEISQLSKALLPALAAAEAASGGVTAASVRQVAAVLFADILLTVIERILLPMVYLYIGVAAAGAVLEGETMERVGDT